MSPRVLLADDHSIIREALCYLISRQTDLEVVGQASNGQEAIDKTIQLSPDLVIMDAALPVLNGIEATKRIKAERPDIKILALSVHDDAEFVIGMIKAGVSGYLLKDCALDDLVEASRTVLSEGSYLSPKIAKVVLDKGIRNDESEQENHDSIPLKKYEIRILRLFADGKSAKEIAEMLGKSVKTIEGNRRHIMDKLGVHSFAALVKYAVKKKLVSGNNLFIKP